MFPKCRTSDSKLLFVKSDTAQTSASVCAPFVRFIHHTNRSRDSGAAPCRSLREILMLLLQTSFSLWNDQTSIPQLRLLPFQSTDSLQKSCFATVQQSTLPPAPILQNHLRSTSSLRRSALFSDVSSLLYRFESCCENFIFAEVKSAFFWKLTDSRKERAFCWGQYRLKFCKDWWHHPVEPSLNITWICYRLTRCSYRHQNTAL